MSITHRANPPAHHRPRMSSLSLRGGKRTRPLGSLRHMMAPDDSKVHLPKLSAAPKSPEEEKLDERYSGIQGNAMTLPSPKETSRSEDRRRSITTSSSRNHSVSKPPSATPPSDGVSHEACERELKEVLGRERDLMDRVAQLQKQVDSLTAQVTQKDGVITTLTSDLATMEENYKQQLQEERTSHEATRHDLQVAQSEVSDALTRLEVQEKESKEKMDLLRLDLTRQMTELAQAKDKEIADRDQKLNRLKMQMADALKGNSWERQQQLEELTKDLARVQEECDVLRSKLKTAAKGKPAGSCGNCAEAAARAEKLSSALKEREATVKELKSLCTRFEKQLSQQDVLLKQWADSKGHKIEVPK
ncbi:uncharacterized protein LOC143274847 [Babylonia areolata]|uniref:uncharacterized protein LOC143274847 n=1 Tax=Babylonia areolata TaxID=304850 RepID=UPI003FD2D8D0